jgi:AAA family ATP:ADP antiporter
LEEIDAPIGKEGAFRLVFKNKYLLLIGLLLLFLNWVNTTGEYILGSIVEDAAISAASSGNAGGITVETYIVKFYGGFFTWVNFSGLLLQLFLVSRILKYLGVRIALLFLPILAIGGYSLIVFFPILSIIRWSKTAENATDYSLQNTVRQVLFLPTTREEKYKAKQAIDTFFVRAGDVLSAALVFLGTTFWAFQTTAFAVVNIGLATIWLILSLIIGKMNMRLTAESRTAANSA